MRITGGEFRNRRIAAPRGWGVRPTTDMVREALFQVAHTRYGRPESGDRVLDLFCGAGTLSFEALSRGAGLAVMVDRSAKSLSVARSNAASIGVEDRVRLIRADLSKAPAVLLEALARDFGPFGLIFMDPPYGKGLEGPLLGLLGTPGLCDPGCLVVVETAFDGKRRDDPGQDHAWGRLDDSTVSLPDPVTLSEVRRYGQTALWFYTIGAEAEKRSRSPVGHG